MRKNHDKNQIWIGGKHTVIHALKNEKNIVYKIILSSKKNIDQVPKKYSNLITIKAHQEIDKLFRTKITHQGYAANIKERKIFQLSELEKHLSNYNEIVILNNVYDDRNIGSVIRSCVAFDIKCLILEKNNFRSSSELMNKSASGGMEYIDIYLVSNLNNVIKILKKNNYWVYSLDGESKKSIFSIKLDKKSAFIFGSEGDGIKSLIKKNSDEIVSIPINKRIESLNLSNSVSVVLLNIKKAR